MRVVVLDTDIFIDFLRGFEKSIHFFESIRKEEIEYVSEKLRAFFK